MLRLTRSMLVRGVAVRGHAREVYASERSADLVIQKNDKLVADLTKLDQTTVKRKLLFKIKSTPIVNFEKTQDLIQKYDATENIIVSDNSENSKVEALFSSEKYKLIDVIVKSKSYVATKGKVTNLLLQKTEFPVSQYPEQIMQSKLTIAPENTKFRKNATILYIFQTTKTNESRLPITLIIDDPSNMTKYELFRHLANFKNAAKILIPNCQEKEKKILQNMPSDVIKSEIEVLYKELIWGDIKNDLENLENYKLIYVDINTENIFAENLFKHDFSKKLNQHTYLVVSGDGKYSLNAMKLSNIKPKNQSVFLSYFPADRTPKIEVYDQTRTIENNYENTSLEEAYYKDNLRKLGINADFSSIIRYEGDKKIGPSVKPRNFKNRIPGTPILASTLANSILLEFGSCLENKKSERASKI